MTTAIVPFSTYPGWNGDDAQFRQWIQHVELVLSTSGLIQTTDTGQLNSSTAVRPNANSNAGSQIWRFNDSRQGVDPIFLRIYYGCGGNNGRTRLQVQVGQGSNGSGVLTGQLSSAVSIGGGWTEAVGATYSISSYGCHTTGFFGMHIAPGTNVGTPRHSVSVSRTRDAGGAFDGLGAVIWYDNTTTAGTRGAIQFVRWLNNAYTGAATDHYCIAVGVPANTALLSGDKQLYPHFYADPSVKSAWAHFTVRNDEITANLTTFSAMPMYGESRTFLHLGQDRNPVGESTYNTNFRYVMLWE